MDYFFADPQIPDGSTSFDTYAGIRGRGAEDSWCLSALEVELAHLEHAELTLVSFDPTKAYDLVLRPVLYTLLFASGFPARVLAAIAGFAEAVATRLAVAGGL
eukprot:2441391-Alexandrium_andersonii.AAC.1